MRQLDSSAINTFGIPDLALMENAGRAFVDVFERHVPASFGKSVLVVCGKGNNGGDGFVIARHLANRGYGVHVILLCRKREPKGSAKTNLDTLLKHVSSRRSSIRFDEVLSKGKLSSVPIPTIVVDAIFGTGFTREVTGYYQHVIEWINASGAFVAAVDIASGVNATNGVVENVAVNANLTVTMGLAKVGHYVGAGRDHSGKVEVVDISIPSFLFKPEKNATLRVEALDVQRQLPKRAVSAHKNSVGRVFVVAGSRTLSGAPFMSAQAAMRTGAGAVVLGVPKSLHSMLVRKATEVMITPLDETEEGTISLSALPAIEEKVRWADVVAIGPGLSMNLETQSVVHHLLKTVEKPIVLDADGINAMEARVSILKKRKAATIITPHVGELKKLLNLDAEEIERGRVDVARSASKALNAVLCLKGAPTATAVPTGNVYLNSTGNPGMATAGSGDVLTGIIVSLLAQGMEPGAAAYCGVHIHGLAGDIAATKFGQRSLMALDILENIPDALNEIEGR
ncbi:MAG: NAD(P)H-hydrate dehydratase [Ignavibacteriae bacterium]|nr:NAD(P)H-hydrate dehydratase [Ignavibacteriota bacterium]